MEEVGEAKEVVTPLHAVVRKDSIEVEDKDRLAELEQAGYGTKSEDALTLRDYEALYLMNAKKLELRDSSGNPVSFEDLAERAQNDAADSWTKFLVYRDLRSRGYVVREGFGFGTDLRVYERGDYPKKAAKYVVFALDEGIEKGIGDLHKSVGEMARMGKEGIIAVIERRGEVIYYKVSKARF